MKKLLVLILLLFWGGSGYTQSGWTPLAPFIKTNPFSATALAVSPSGSHIYLGKEEGGILCSTDQGSTWQQVADYPVYAVVVRSDGTVFAGGNGHLYRSSDNGQTWTALPLATTHPVNKIVFNSKGHVVAGTCAFANSNAGSMAGDGVFISEDNGQTWQNRIKGLGGTLGIWQLAVDKHDRLYMAMLDDNHETQGGGLYTLAPATDTWQPIPISVQEIKNINVSVIHALVLDEHQNIYLTVEGSVGKAGVLCTLKSEDAGATWQNLALEASPFGYWYDILSFYSLYMSRSGTLWGGTTTPYGIFRSGDKGHNWTQQTSGFRPALGRNYDHIVFAETADGLLFGLQVFDNKVYKVSSPLQAEKLLEAPKLQVQAYPNPFREQLSINYNLKAPASVQITITDALGRSVYEQTQVATAGTNALTWQPGRAAAGVYYVKLQQGKNQHIQQVVLTR